MQARYRIWTGKRWHYFATLESARAVASEIFDQTGIIVGIEHA